MPGHLPNNNATLPATKRNTEVKNQTRPETPAPANLLRVHAVSGHAEIPDSIANQPFVSGSGPFSKRSRNPPPPATIAQAQAPISQSVRAGLPVPGAFRAWVGSIGMETSR
jgi:hypothetical protein